MIFNVLYMHKGGLICKQIPQINIGYIGHFGKWKNRVLDFRGKIGDMPVI